MRNSIKGAILFILLNACIDKKATNESFNKVKLATSYVNVNSFDSQEGVSHCDITLMQDYLKSVNNKSWLPTNFIKDIYCKGISHVERNNTDYPFESVYIENWGKKIIFSQSANRDYRKVRVLEINDSTYYLTNWNKNNYKSSDSIFIAKRKNQISVITENDSIPYTDGIDSFRFTDPNLLKNVLAVSVFHKSYDLFDEDENKIDEAVTFDVLKNEVVNSQNFKTFNFTGYYLDGYYQMKLDGINYFFNWNGKDIILRSTDGRVLRLEQQFK
ncbi:hypothetical protein [Cellulophaga sp. Z1A5H]|uniref:hypothetical protein n=1 Tax=Cellulophaga sp. Z1A5H TaxID=2687291 RepID=UPI0013FD8823|nr:hypothetical protein [Cellulophaga sp. Z1A5H]